MILTLAYPSCFLRRIGSRQVPHAQPHRAPVLSPQFPLLLYFHAALSPRRPENRPDRSHPRLARHVRHARLASLPHLSRLPPNPPSPRTFQSAKRELARAPQVPFLHVASSPSFTLPPASTQIPPEKFFASGYPLSSIPATLRTS